VSTDLEPLVVVLVVGLTPRLLGRHTPNINALIEDGFMAPLDAVYPAVTCTAQSSMLTGSLPSQHGIVANGWYFRDLAEVWLWRQSNRLVKGEKVWETARRDLKGFTTAQLFWWYNMYANVDYSVTPRPIYPADGRKIPALYSSPATLHTQLEDKLGPFPFFHFWGPKADILSSRWISACAREVVNDYRPTLTLVYLPHLDYNLQRLGPRDPAVWQDVALVDQEAGKLIEHARARGANVMILSEYGIEATQGHIDINRVLREHGFLSVREVLGTELLDCGASRAFAVADHQIAHLYVQSPLDALPVKETLSRVPGIERLLTDDKAAWGLDHENAGELIAIPEPGYWFTYYYWLDDAKAPDFARTVDIHRKPGFDPVELFIDPELRWPRLKITGRLLQKKLGLRYLMDVIPLKPELVKGTHGRLPASPDEGPLVISSNRRLQAERFAMTDVKRMILQHWL
jgi:predicted AlkP superfamily pyrophosphatase or phosphodiesterase